MAIKTKLKNKMDTGEISLKLPCPAAFPPNPQNLFMANPADYTAFNLPGHSGLDFLTPLGTPVTAAAGGIIQRIGDDPLGYGLFVLLRHNGFDTLYAHLSRVLLFGDQVISTNNLPLASRPRSRIFSVADYNIKIAGLPKPLEIPCGEMIGLSGNSGNSTGPHLHFELRIHGEERNGINGCVDPTPYFCQAQTAGENTGHRTTKKTPDPSQLQNKPPLTSEVPTTELAVEPDSTITGADPSNELPSGAGRMRVIALRGVNVRFSPVPGPDTRFGSFPAGSILPVEDIIEQEGIQWARGVFYYAVSASEEVICEPC